MNITDYSEEQIKQLVRDGICGPQALRDYEALKKVKNGGKIQDVAMDHNISRQWLTKIRKKYGNF
jgi:hypothetical protein